MEGMGDSYSELMQRLQSSLGTCSASKSAGKCSSFSLGLSQPFPASVKGFSHNRRYGKPNAQTVSPHLPPLHSQPHTSQTSVQCSQPFPASGLLYSSSSPLDVIKKEPSPSAPELSKDSPASVDVSMDDQESSQEPPRDGEVQHSSTPSSSIASKSQNLHMDQPPRRNSHRRAHSDIPLKFVSGMGGSPLGKVVGDLDQKIAKEVMPERKARRNGIEETRSVWDMDSEMERDIMPEEDSWGAEPKEEDKEGGSTDGNKEGDVDGKEEDLFSMYIDMEKINSFNGVADHNTDVVIETGDGKHAEAEKVEIKQEVLEEKLADEEKLRDKVRSEDLGLQLGKKCQHYEMGFKKETPNRSELPSSEDIMPVGNSNNQPLPSIGGEKGTTASFSMEHVGERRKAFTEKGGSQHFRSISMDSLLGNFQSIKRDAVHHVMPLSENMRVRHLHSNSMDGSTDLKINTGREEQDDWMKKVMANDKLAEIALVDPKRAKRILANRQSAARSKERKMQYISELECKVQTLQTEATTLSAQVAMLQRGSTSLMNKNSELKLRLQAMEQQAQLRAALNDALREEAQRLKLAVGQISCYGTTIAYNSATYIPMSTTPSSATATGPKFMWSKRAANSC